MTPRDGAAASGAIPTADMLRERAQALIPFLLEQQPKHLAARRVTEDTIGKLRAAGLFRVLQPRRYGGYEMSPSVFTDVLITLAKADPSVGFVYGILGVHNFHMGFYDERAALDVWGADQDVLVASPYAPMGKAVRVEGGFRMSGRWSFSSGCDNCDWTFLSGVIQGEEHVPLVQRMHAFLIPRQDARIVDNWHVMGLQGTGSKDVVVEDAFIPAHRVERFPIIDPTGLPGLKVNTGPLFRMPFMPVFYRAVSSAAIGALEGMLEHFSAFTSGRLTVLSEVAARDPYVQMAAAQAAAGLAEMKATLKSDIAEMEAIVAAGGAFNPLRAQEWMLNSANVPHRAADLGMGLLRAAGANGIRTDKNIARYFNDIVVIGQHAACTPKAAGGVLGKMMLGVMD